jgi:hypothetical protein
LTSAVMTEKTSTSAVSGIITAPVRRSRSEEDNLRMCVAVDQSGAQAASII